VSQAIRNELNSEPEVMDGGHGKSLELGARRCLMITDLVILASTQTQSRCITKSRYQSINAFSQLLRLVVQHRVPPSSSHLLLRLLVQVVVCLFTAQGMPCRPIGSPRKSSVNPS
jgi:hypothetical protein